MCDKLKIEERYLNASSNAALGSKSNFDFLDLIKMKFRYCIVCL
jgi:hypothetical protein